MSLDVERTVTVTLPQGDIGISAWHRVPSKPWAMIVLAHGAGAGVQHPFFDGLVAALAEAGVASVRFTFPYLQQGRRMPGPAAHAISTWRAVMAHTGALSNGVPIWAAGKSYGGRMASMAAADEQIDPAGLVYLGYPLHPPGRPEKLRVEHLPRVRAPQLFVSGTNDPFVTPHAQLVAAVDSCQRADLRWIDGGGHSFEVKGRKRPAAEIAAELVGPIVEWMRAGGQRPAA